MNNFLVSVFAAVDSSVWTTVFLAIIGIIMVVVIIFFVKSLLDQKEYSKTSLPDLDAGDKSEEDDTEEESAFDLSMDEDDYDDFEPVPSVGEDDSITMEDFDELPSLGADDEEEAFDDFFERAEAIALEYLSKINKGAPIGHKFLENSDSYRFFQDVHGGASIIVGRDGTFLFANSSVPPKRHEAAFVANREAIEQAEYDGALPYLDDGDGINADSISLPPLESASDPSILPPVASESLPGVSTPESGSNGSDGDVVFQLDDEPSGNNAPAPEAKKRKGGIKAKLKKKP